MGTSQSNTNYQYVDNNQFTGICYYRIREVDFEGNSKFSDIVSVVFGKKLVLTLQQNQPSPFTAIIAINISIPLTGRVKLMLYDQLGRPVRQLVDEIKTPATTR